MPEGDTIHHAARRIRPLLEGRVPDRVATLHPRFAADRWAERLAGRAVTAVEARGKHLLIRFEGGLVVHSHLRMTGHWGTYRAGQRWGRSRRRAWLLLEAGEAQVVQFDGPVLELLTAARARADRRLTALGPDIVADDFDEREALRRLRADDPTRPIGDALLHQRTVAGIGNLWKSEGCWRARIDPWRPAGAVTDEEVLAVLRETRPLMRRSSAEGSHRRLEAIYGRTHRPCPRCGARVLERAQGDDGRATFWCEGCQR